MTWDVFLAFASPERATARAWRDALGTRGVRAFVSDVDLTAGHVWDESIHAAQRSARLTGVVLTPLANASPHVRAEVQRGIAWRHGMVPWNVGAVAHTDWPSGLASWQVVVGSVQDAADAVVAALADASPPPPPNVPPVIPSDVVWSALLTLSRSRFIDLAVTAQVRHLLPDGAPTAAEQADAMMREVPMERLVAYLRGANKL